MVASANELSRHNLKTKGRLPRPRPSYVIKAYTGTRNLSCLLNKAAISVREPQTEPLSLQDGTPIRGLLIMASWNLSPAPYHRSRLRGIVEIYNHLVRVNRLTWPPPLMGTAADE
jgi:hypothetical protein